MLYICRYNALVKVRTATYNYTAIILKITSLDHYIVMYIRHGAKVFFKEFYELTHSYLL